MARGADGNITAVVFMEFSVTGSSIDIIQELSAVLTPEQVAVDPASLETVRTGPVSRHRLRQLSYFPEILRM